MKTLTAIIALCAIAFIGCETTKGAGKDLENTGTNVQEGMKASTTNNTTDNATGLGTNPDQSTYDGTGGNSSDMGGY